jgi:hypothetical protein
MDTKKIIEEVKYRFKHQENKLYLKEKYSNSLVFTNQSGLWTADTNFLSFLSSLKFNSTLETIVIEDNYSKPILVNVDEIYHEAFRVYQQVMNEWLTEYKESENNR